MAGDLRKSWQAFKKAHPTFEKSKAFKSDLGPQLDQLEKGFEDVKALEKAEKKKAAEHVVELSDLRAATEKKAVQVLAIGKSVSAALKGYEAVIKDLQDSDKTIMKDYKDLTLECVHVLDSVKTK